MTREEELYAAIVAALKAEGYTGEVPAYPSWRSEEFLMGILAGIKGVAGASVPTPVWDEEKYLAAIFDQVDGGVVNCKLLGSKEFTVSTTSSVDVGTITVPGAFTSDSIIYVKIRDKAGKRTGYLLGSDSFFLNQLPANGSSTGYATIGGKASTFVNSQGKFALVDNRVSSAGIVPYNIPSDGTITIKAAYSSQYGTINGTYVVEVYALSWPKGDSPFK